MGTISFLQRTSFCHPVPTQNGPATHLLVPEDMNVPATTPAPTRDDETWTGAEESRAKLILQACGQKISKAVMQASKIETKYNYRMGQYLDAAIRKAIEDQCNKIIAASKAKPKVINALEQERKDKKAARRRVATALKEAKKKLRYMETRLDALTGDVLQFQTSAFSAAEEYPPVPPPAIPATADAAGVPSRSGIYFVWRDGIVNYVGQSISLASRLKFASHGKIKDGDMLSWIFFDVDGLNFAESYYIGVLRPVRNFGVRRKKAT